ncbi:MAG: serine/threonine protein kinase [Myxococcales bacterium]|nr:serine/threonine protein kinase [Myxococcales bacterium]
MSGEGLDVRALVPGTVLLDKYRVVGPIGAGGMGVVIACDHLAMGTSVAIKFLLPEFVANRSIVQRFLNEARAATRIESEHVARVLDVGSMQGPGLPERGVPYMVMEHLRGHDLAHWIKSGVRFSIADAISFVTQASEALAEAHKVGIIHRDVKPANLFLAEYETRQLVKVLDFGISKLLENEPQEMGLTKTTTILGSGLYMSPEQMRSAKNVDPRTDIYSLGVCLFELLTGTQPFTAESFSELCVKVNIDPPTPLRSLRHDVSEELAAIIARSYARTADERFASMQEFAAALEPFSAPLSAATLKKLKRHSIAEFHPSALALPMPTGIAPAASAIETSDVGHVATERDPTKHTGMVGLSATNSAVAVGGSGDRPRKSRSLGFMLLTIALAFVGAGITGSLIRHGVSDANSSPSSAATEPALSPSALASSRPAIALEEPPTRPSAELGIAGLEPRSDSDAAPASSAIALTTPPDSSAAPQSSATAKPVAASSAKTATAPARDPRPPNRTCIKKDPISGLMMPCDLVP